MAKAFETQGMDMVVAKLRKLPQIIDATCDRWIRKTSQHASDRAEENAPILTGTLRVDCGILPVQKSGDSMWGGVECTVPYAGLMHEHQWHYGGVPAPLSIQYTPNNQGHIYSHGPVTMQQPRTVEGGPGGKFIARVLNFHAQAYLDDLADQFTQMLVTM